MATGKDDETLFDLQSAESAAPPGRTTIVRQAIAGLLLLLAAAGAAWLLPAVLTDGPAQSDDTVLPVDGTPYPAETSAERESMLWFDAALRRAHLRGPRRRHRRCARHRADRRPQRSTPHPDRRLGGRRDVRPRPRRRSRSTCSAALGTVLVTQAPGQSAGLVALGAIVLVPLTLAMAGLVLVVAAATAVVQGRAARG